MLHIYPQHINHSAAQCDCGVYPFLQMSYQESVISTAYIELIRACNNHCSGCGNIFTNNKPNSNNSSPLSMPEWNTVIDKLKPQIRHLNITGGEPTLSPYFDEFIQQIDHQGFTFTLFTNARWHHPHSVIKTLKQAKGFKGLLISLHGKDVQTHESFTMTSGSFKETLQNIRLAVSSGISVHVCTIITRHNCTQVREIYDLAKSLHVRKLVFNRYVGFPEDDCAPNQEQLKQALADIEDMRISGDAVKLSVTIPQCFYPSSAAGCGAGKTYITIDPCGNVRPCNHAPLILGNLCREFLDDVLHSGQLASWHNMTPSACKECSAFEFCGGGCKAEAMLNRQSQDSLMRRPFLQKHGAKFLAVSEDLHPILIPSPIPDIFPSDMDCQTRHMLTNSLDGSITLKELGIRHGQNMLNLIGAMHHAGIVEFR